MASGLPAGRNESNLARSRAGFMAKTLMPNPNCNPNHPPSKKRKQQHQKHPYANAGQFKGSRCESPSVSQSASGDNLWSNHQETLSNIDVENVFHRGGYVCFDLSSYSKTDLIELKNRLHQELEDTRCLKTRIGNGELRQKANDNSKAVGRGLKRANSLTLASSCRESNRIAMDGENASLLKMCGQVLGKLSKHKDWKIFSSPVDVKRLKLHDYNHIVKKPMDLGTVKSNLSKNLYPTPAEFAADVRLTFDNAVLYNPKGNYASDAAEVLLSWFEELFQPISERLTENADDEAQNVHWNGVPQHDKLPKRSSLPSFPKKPERVLASAGSASNPAPMQSPVPTPSSPARTPPVKPLVTKTSNGKLPKPKAKDPNKRAMSLEEKQRLGLGLQSLPQQKMVQVVQIIRKRNAHMTDEGDEIELDIEAIDTETLWELDRLLTNWKKMVSKFRRQNMMGNNASAIEPDDRLPPVEGPDAATEDARRPKNVEVGEEDIDIGDDIPATNFPPVEIEKDDGPGIVPAPAPAPAPATSSSSGSSSSSSHSSSSSDSDSGSSSGSDSEAGDLQCREPEPKNLPKI